MSSRVANPSSTKIDLLGRGLLIAPPFVGARYPTLTPQGVLAGSR
jgi:hypothetical protein